MQSQLHLTAKMSPTRSHRLLLTCLKQKRRVRRLIPPELGDAPNGFVPRGREVRFAYCTCPMYRCHAGTNVGTLRISKAEIGISFLRLIVISCLHRRLQPSAHRQAHTVQRHLPPALARLLRGVLPIQTRPSDLNGEPISMHVQCGLLTPK